MLDAEMLFKMILKKGIDTTDTYFLTASDDEFISIRKVNVLIMNTFPPTNSDTIALKDAIYKRFNNDCHVVDTVIILDDFMERHNPIHFDYFIFMDDWGGAEYYHPELNTTREKVVEELYFTNHPWEYAWKNSIITPINHERDLDEKLRALSHDILQERI